MASLSPTTDRKPNGPALAAILSAGIGSLFLGLMTTGAVISAGLKTALTLSKPVGPLHGKVVVAVAAYALSWAILFFMWRGKDVNARPIFIATFILVGLGLLFTFPVFFDLFG